MDWFRFYSDAINDRKFRRIAFETQQPVATVLGIWTIVLSIASESPVRGALLIGPLPANENDVSMAAGCNVSETFQKFCETGLVTQVDGVWCVSAWDKRQYASDASSERVRAYRERAKNGQNPPESPDIPQDVTLPERYNGVSVTPSEYRVQSTDKRESVTPTVEGVTAQAPPPSKSISKRERAPKAPPPAEIELVRSITNRYPDKALWDSIVSAVSGKSEGDIEACYTTWVARGFNPTNYAWLLEWVPNGIPPAPGRNGRVRPTAPNGLPAPEMVWGMVQAEIDRVHYSGSPNLPTPVLDAVEAVGGWYVVCKCDPSGAIPARLRDAYRSVIGA